MVGVYCIFCKSRFHTYKNCPIVWRNKTILELNAKAKKDFIAEAPSIFVGSYAYPRVRAGLLSVENYNHHDEPRYWSKENFQIKDIVNKRLELINAFFKIHVQTNSLRFLDIAKEVSISKKPVAVELSLTKKPKFQITFNHEAKPHGPNIELKNSRLIDVPKTDSFVEKLVYDYDLKASEAVNILYKKGYEDNTLTKLLSIGNLGIRTERKIVPTRWSITAVDDIVGKNIIKEIKNYPCIEKAEFLSGNYLGNYYYLCFFPGVWGYELFEQFVSLNRKALFVEHDYESFYGRKNYAEETAGGYYAARLSILEYLKRIKKQASVLAIRIVTEEYTTPLGVWVCRESVRKATISSPIYFIDNKILLDYVKNIILQKHLYDISSILQNSRILKEVRQQKNIKNYI